MAHKTFDPIKVGSLEDLKKKGHLLVSVDRPVVVFYHQGKVYAVDNRCPHLGFPLHRGTLEDGILTCHWHHARFDLSSGCTFDLFADDVPTYPVEMRNGDVWLLPPPPRDEVTRRKERLREGLEYGFGIVTAKQTCALLHDNVDERELVRLGAELGTRYRDTWGPGMTIMTAMANLMPYLEQEEKFLPLWHGLMHVADNIAGEPPRRERQPLESSEASLETLKRWLRQWTLVRHRDGAERCVLTAVANGASPEEVAEMLLTAATDRIFADGGHLVDFINKTFELLDIIGWEHAAEILPTLMSQLASARGGEEQSAFRQPIDLTALFGEWNAQIPNALATGRGRQWEDNGALVEVLLGDQPEAIGPALLEALKAGATPVQLGRLVAYAAAVRIAQFGTSNEFPDWIQVLHTFTYCNAAHQLLKRLHSHITPESVRSIFHGALRVYLDRFLNFPPAPLPDKSPELAKEPEDAELLQTKFRNTLDRQAQVTEAGLIVYRYLSLGQPVKPLLSTLTDILVREDAEFHSYQMLEAAVRQFEEWRRDKEGWLILSAAARYLAAHSPTQREMLQTATIAQRLHRGEALYEEV